MNFNVGSYVEWKHIKGYIRFVSDDYISICVNVYDDGTRFDCCVVCHNSYWKDVIVHNDVAPIYPIMYASVAQW